MRGALGLLVVGCWLLAGSATAQTVGTVRFADGLAAPTFLTAAPGDVDRVFVAELPGQVQILDTATGAPRPAPFVSVTANGEGLAGIAFHPDYDTNGFVYLHFQLNGVGRVLRFTRSANPDLADPNSQLQILEIPQASASAFHNGGWLDFGPDGYLYLAVGDGGNQNDPNGLGQNTVGELRGNVLRIDVDADDFPADPLRNYAIPTGNPFAGVAGEDEIWSYGFRNPYRGSFDRLTGDLYIADVGQDTREEINFEPFGAASGRNYGWRVREGSLNAVTLLPEPPPPGFTDPLYEYAHGGATNEGASVTGGYVYRGPVASLIGRYFFGDFISERIWSIRQTNGVVTEFVDWTDAFVPDVGTIDQIVGFGEDALGNLYIVDLGGEIFRVVGPTLPVPVLGLWSLALFGFLLVCVIVRVTGFHTRAV